MILRCFARTARAVRTPLTRPYPKGRQGSGGAKRLKRAILLGAGVLQPAHKIMEMKKGGYMRILITIIFCSLILIQQGQRQLLRFLQARGYSKPIRFQNGVF